VAKLLENTKPRKDLALPGNMAAHNAYADYPDSATSCYDIELPSAKYLREYMGPEKLGGVYCIYARHKNMASSECFYVGVAQSCIYDQLNQHLCGDIRDKGRYGPGKQKAYTWFSEPVEVVICYAVIQHGNNEKSKSRLELLEDCLTVMLRPKYLILTAQ
jgi:hypothetical protein